MTTSTYTPSGAGRTEFFAKSGLPDFDITGTVTPSSYAERLVRYISDPSTVRARVLEQFGRAPAIDKITAMRAEHVRIEQARKRQFRIEAWPEKEPEPRAPKPAPVKIAAKPTKSPKSVVYWRDMPMNTAREVIAAVAAAMGVDARDIIGPSRVGKIVRPRHLAATILKARGNSYPQVARFLGRSDHSSAFNSVHKFFCVMMRDPMVASLWHDMAPAHVKHVKTLDEYKAVVG